MCASATFDGGSSGQFDGGVGALNLVAQLSATVSGGSDINAAALVDGDVNTAWTLACTGTGLFCCEPTYATVTWVRNVTLTAIVIRTATLPGQVVTGQLELLRPDGGVAVSRPILLDGDDGDFVQYFLAGPVVPQISSIRFFPGWATSAAPAISEIEIYGN